MIDVVVGILRQGEKILVGQRPLDKPYSGYWEFPGGKVEPNETHYVALARELNEELGITVTEACSWLTHSHDYPDKKVLLDIWYVTAFTGELQAKEHQALRWVTFDELLTLRVLEGNWAIIERLKRIRGLCQKYPDFSE